MNLLNKTGGFAGAIEKAFHDQLTASQHQGFLIKHFIYQLQQFAWAETAAANLISSAKSFGEQLVFSNS
jgi:hypothetical protein